MDEAPTCITCRFCDWPHFATGSQSVIEITAACFHPTVKAHPSPVTGVGDGKSAFLTRELGPCGPDALFYEPKASKP